MALIRVAQYNSTPTLVTDYQAQNAHLQAFTNQLMTQQFILSEGTAQPVIKQGCYVSHGGSLYIADADTAITGSPSDGSVYIRVSGTTSLTVEFVNDISGYAWNPVYSALTSGSYTLLPYLIVKASAVWTRYNFNPNGQAFGALQCTSIDTGQGANELYPMNQDVRTTASPSFEKLTITTSVQGSIVISKNSTWIIPAGIYVIAFGSQEVMYEQLISGEWVPVSNDPVSSVVISDGANFRLREVGITDWLIKYRKFS
jgi:hypothetical protein